jgi:hypothetical protein
MDASQKIEECPSDRGQVGPRPRGIPDRERLARPQADVAGSRARLIAHCIPITSLTESSTVVGVVGFASKARSQRRTHRTWAAPHEQLKKLLMLTCRIFPVVCPRMIRNGRPVLDCRLMLRYG